jgi:hypothetical protein
MKGVRFYVTKSTLRKGKGDMEFLEFIGRHQNIEEGQREMARYVAYQRRNLEWIEGK